MIYGVGTDIISVERITSIYGKNKERFINKILSENELEKFNSINPDKKVIFLASRWAAKEAVVKAFGLGFTKGLYLTELTIKNNQHGRPIVSLSHSAKSQVKQLLDDQDLIDNYIIHLSISHELAYATSTAVVELL